MRLMRAVALAALAIGGARARATTLIPMSDATLVHTSALIALGDVRRVEARALPDGRIVTETTILVARTLKGRLRTGKIVVTEPGGRVAGRSAVVFGTPEFSVGERVLVFLKRSAEGRLRTNALALGKYRVEAASPGGPVARRALPTPDVRDLDRFLAAIARLARDDAQELAPSGRVAADAAVAPYTFLGNPPARWFDPNVILRLANGDPTFGVSQSQAIITSAMAAWTNVAAASVAVSLGASTVAARSVAGGVCDGVSTIQYNDPFNEVTDLNNCTGVLAVGGYCNSGETMSVNGMTVVRIVEGDVTVNNGVATCFGATNTAEVLTHELGHALGMGHSSENPNEPNPVLEDATMYYLAHFDGRGAAVHADDIAGITALYPASDGDGDGVPDANDACPSTAPGLAVDASGCACADAGHVSCDDGSACTTDACDATTAACTHTQISCADADPCTLDSCNSVTGCVHTQTVDGNNDGICDGAEDNDGDGVVTALDACPNTPAGDPVDAVGCACDDPGHQSCDDANACTTDACDPATAACTHVAVSCDDGDPCTVDACDMATGCTHVAGTDADGDGVCDAIDDCPLVPDAVQADTDGDGIGDACECRSKKPGRCVPGIGPASKRCSVEWLPLGGTAPRHGLPPATLRCTDGDPGCDADAIAGQCTFQVLVCINNSDPRFRACVPYHTSSLEVLTPNGTRPRDAVDGANAAALESALDLDTQRPNDCSAPVSLVVPLNGSRPGVRTFMLRARTSTGPGKARLKLVCMPAR